MPTPFFSIVVTTHSRPILLERALRSITQQQFDDYEIILVADEGSQATYEVAARSLRARDTFVKRSGPPGPATSRNIGINLSQGQFILFLDDDDSHRENCLLDLYQSMAAAKSEVFYFNYETIEELRTDSSPIIKSRTPVDLSSEKIENLLIYNFIPNNAFAINSGVAKKIKFDENLRSHEDWEFLIAIVRDGCNFIHMPVLGVSVHHDSNSSQRNSDAKKVPNWSFDILCIYWRWPTMDAEQKQRRQNALRALGHDIPLSAL